MSGRTSPGATCSRRNSQQNIDAIPITYDGCRSQFHHFYGDCLLLRLNSVCGCFQPLLAPRHSALAPFASVVENRGLSCGTLSKDNFLSTETDRSWVGSKSGKRVPTPPKKREPKVDFAWKIASRGGTGWREIIAKKVFGSRAGLCQDTSRSMDRLFLLLENRHSRLPRRTWTRLKHCFRVVGLSFLKTGTHWISFSSLWRFCRTYIPREHSCCRFKFTVWAKMRKSCARSSRNRIIEFVEGFPRIFQRSFTKEAILVE